MKEYEIWLGYYHLGQGHHGSIEPEMVAKVKATSFKVACWLYELYSAYTSLIERMEKGGYIEDAHFGISYYKPETNSNSWTGKYYETKEEAQKSFDNESM